MGARVSIPSHLRVRGCIAKWTRVDPRDVPSGQRTSSVEELSFSDDQRTVRILCAQRMNASEVKM